MSATGCTWNGTLQEGTVAIASQIAPSGSFSALNPQILSNYDQKNQPKCSLYTYNLDEIMASPNPELIINEWMTYWKNYAVQDSNERLLRRFFQTPLVGNTSCSQPDPFWSKDASYQSYYANRCLPIAATDLNGDIARMYASMFPKDAGLIMSNYCLSSDINTGNPNDPRCSCFTKNDPTGNYQYLDASNGIMLPPSCWFSPCRNPSTFYNDPTIPACTSIPSCSSITNIIVKAGGSFDGQVNNAINCSASGDSGGSSFKKVVQYIEQNPKTVAAGMVGVLGVSLIVYALL